MTVKLIGMKSQKKAAYEALEKGLPVLLYGFTGNGKTLLANEVAEEYSKKHKIPVIYMQLYPEMTKNSLIGGETLKNGSIVVDKQSLIKFGEKGAIFIIDECTHTVEPVLLAFNSLIEAPHSTVIGSKIVKLSNKTRFIFCGNFPDHTGNIPLPTSFANRLFVIKSEMPSKVELKELGKAVNPNVPEDVLDLVAKIILDTHDPSFPISPRNMVTFCINYGKSGAKIKSPELKAAILSSLMGNVVFKTDGPKKVEALLWD